MNGSSARGAQARLPGLCYAQQMAGALPRRDSRAAAVSWAARGVIASVAIFAVAIAISIATYPGGSSLDPDAAGHDLWRNFLCDLIHPISISGEPSPVASTLAPLGMLALVAGLAATWAILPCAFPRERVLGRVVRIAGALSTLGLVAVPLTPSSEHPVLHPIAVFLAGVPALVAGIAAALGLARGGARVLAGLGAALIATTAIDLAIFAVHGVLGGPVPLVLPALERVGTALLLAWMLGIARRLARRRPLAGRSGHDMAHAAP